MNASDTMVMPPWAWPCPVLLGRAEPVAMCCMLKSGKLASGQNSTCDSQSSPAPPAALPVRSRSAAWWWCTTSEGTSPLIRVERVRLLLGPQAQLRAPSAYVSTTAARPDGVWCGDSRATLVSVHVWPGKLNASEREQLIQSQAQRMKQELLEPSRASFLFLYLWVYTFAYI